MVDDGQIPSPERSSSFKLLRQQSHRQSAPPALMQPSGRQVADPPQPAKPEPPELVPKDLVEYVVRGLFLLRESCISLRALRH